MNSILKDLAYEIKHMDRSRKAVRRFGLILAVILCAVGAFLWYKDAAAWPYFAAGGIVSGGAALLWPKGLTLVYLGLTMVSIVIGYFISRILLITIFLIFFVPVGLLSRLFRRDLLNRKLDAAAPTYWLKKDHAALLPEHYERLY